MPAFVFGTRLAQMITGLESIKTKNKGAGKFFYDENEEEFVGEVSKITDSSYYLYDKQRYTDYL